MSSLGEALRNSRRSVGLSLKQVSEQCSITNSRLSKMERDQIPCKLDELIQLVKLYNVPVVEFFMATGCFTADDLGSYQKVFQGVDFLDEDEKEHIQRTIDLLTRKKGER
ncbi:MAG: helix-turn-helix transcriptional regulator [Clostridia bacterium]|nr:helix-turn-helix transcriptional regulator [Clostridia bacterium]